MIIHYISDLHGHRPNVNGGHLLIVGGDHHYRDKIKEVDSFSRWIVMCADRYDHVVYIGGNHDEKLERHYVNGYDKKMKEITNKIPENVHYLCDSGVNLLGLNIYGSPYSLLFFEQNNSCRSFCGDESYLEEKFSHIPKGTDILVTHSPPFGILDKNVRGNHLGSTSLRSVVERIRPQVHVFGHIHEGGPSCELIDGTMFINCSFIDEKHRMYRDFPFV